MRVIPDSLAARLGGATTLCHCWRLVLRDGSRLGFTDHDRDITFDGLSLTGASVLYPAAQEISDYGAAQSVFDLQAFQKSAAVGRGFGLTARVTL